MSFYTDPIKQGGWPQQWTIFYWAWWIAYTPMMVTFVTCISKGRTIKELIIGECIFGTLGCWVVLCSLGAYSLFVNQDNSQNLLATVQDSDTAQTVTLILNQLPGSSFMIIFYLVLGFIFCATSQDSCAYVLACISQDKESQKKKKSLNYHTD